MENPTLQSTANCPSGEIRWSSKEDLTLRNTANCPPAGAEMQHNTRLQKYTVMEDPTLKNTASYTTQQITHCARNLARKKQSLWSLSCSSWSSTKVHQLDPQHYDILQSIGLTLHVEEENPQNQNIVSEIWKKRKAQSLERKINDESL